MKNDEMNPTHPRVRQARSSERLLRAIAEAQEFYDARYRELVGPEETEWRHEDDAAASWLSLLRGPSARNQRATSR